MWRKAGMLGAAMVLLAGTGVSDEPNPLEIRAEAETELCLDPADDRLADYAEGRRRAVLALHSATAGASPLLVSADTGEETTLGLFPGGAFAAGSPLDATRFFLPGSPETRCWTVAISGDGAARVTLELSEPLE